MAGLTAVARDAALKEAKDAGERCHAAEAKLKTLRDQLPRQLEVREEKVKAQEEEVTVRDAELEQLA